MEVDPPNIIDSPSSLFPFSGKKFIFSLNSEFFKDTDATLRNHSKQLAVYIDDEQLLHKHLPEFPCEFSGCKKTFNSVHDYEIHHRMSHSFICISCKKTFPSYNLLDRHLEEVHDNYFSAEKRGSSKPLYSCLAPGCEELFASGEERKEHCIKVHLYPADFKFAPFTSVKRSSKDMELDSVAVGKKVFSNKLRRPVPHNVCFGRGAERSFVIRKRATSRPSGDINMADISDSLNEIL